MHFCLGESIYTETLDHQIFDVLAAMVFYYLSKPRGARDHRDKYKHKTQGGQIGAFKLGIKGGTQPKQQL